MAAQMRAVLLTGYGGPEVLRPGRLPVPAPGPGQVLVRVRAAGVNPADLLVRSGGRRALTRARPYVPGSDVAGEVTEVGAGVAGWRPGQRVFALLARFAGGGYAEYALATPDALAAMPAGLSFDQAAALPRPALTALRALRDLARLRAGQSVVVNGASGAVGSTAVQLARHLGAEVTGVAGPGRLDRVRALGARHVVDYTREDFTRTGHRWDVVLDAAGTRRFRDARRALTPAGAFVTTAARPATLTLDRLTRAWPGPAARVVLVRPDGTALATLAGLIEGGALTAPEPRPVALEHAARAHARLEGGDRGKWVLTP